MPIFTRKIYPFQSHYGIFSILDDEHLRPGMVNDQSLLCKLDLAFGNHPHYESRGCKECESDISLNDDSFRLRHYAGVVRYSFDFSFSRLLICVMQHLFRFKFWLQMCRFCKSQVTYSTAGFLEKNLDHFSRDLSQAMFQSEHELLKSLFLEGKLHHQPQQ